MSTEAPPKPIQFQLAAGRRAIDYRAKGAAIVNEERKAKLHYVPPGLPEVVGDYGTIAALASRLNEQQIRSNFLDYLYWPEVVGAVDAPPPQAGEDPLPEV